MAEILVYGTVQSASLLLMALGFSLVYGVCRLPNFAHGAIYVFTGFVAWHLAQFFPYPVAALGALAAAAGLGVLIYQLVLRFIRGMEIAEVIATWAVGLGILEGLRWAGLRGATYTLPTIASGADRKILGVPIDNHRLMVVVAAVVIVLALWIGTRSTRLGLALRAVAQDERAAMMLGIDSDRMGTVAMALGAVLSGLGALLLLPLGSIVVQEGYKVLIYAVAVAVLGGLGSWGGTILASVVLGFAQVLTVTYGRPHYQMVVTLGAILLVLIFRPSGLFGKQKELAERV
jgi:branched-chain amino acid transport system permease protein